ARAAGEGHEKPVTYYLELLANGWSGKIIWALALLGAGGTAFRLRRHTARVIPEAPFPAASPLPVAPELKLANVPAPGPASEAGQAAPGKQNETHLPGAPVASQNPGTTMEEEIEWPVDRGALSVLVVYALATWVIYSLIPYKTPWLALNLWLPLTLLA